MECSNRLPSFGRFHWVSGLFWFGFYKVPKVSESKPPENWLISIVWAFRMVGDDFWKNVFLTHF